MWTWLKTAASWLWKPLAAIGVLLAARAIMKSKDNRISNLKDALSVEVERRKVAASEAKIQVFKEQAIEKARQSATARHAAADSKRKIVAIESNAPTEEMSDAQIAEAFSKLRF